MASDKYYLGLDVSTQGAKLVLLDYALGRAVFTAAADYDRDLPQYGTRNGACVGLAEGVSESEPGMWLDAVRLLFDRLKESGCDPARVRAVSVSGQQHGLVCLDGSGELARRRGKLWNDVSTAAECAELTAAVGGEAAMLSAVLNTQRPGYTAGKILHFRKHEPEAWRRTATLFLVHNYVNWYLTGGVRVMEPGDVSGMALWNPVAKDWAANVCAAVGPDLIEKLPPVKPADEFIGVLAPELCRRYGFAEDCRVDAGCGDNMYGALGTANVREGVVTVSLGTSGTAYTFSEKPYASPDGDIASFCDSTGHYLALLCVSNLANGYNDILRSLGLTHDGFCALVEKSAPGNGGALLLPWFQGERTPNLPLAAPVTLGFGPGDFTPERLCRAVLEGHVMNLYEGYLKLPIRAERMHLTGGLAKSRAWRRTIADVFEAEVVAVKGEGAALGAAVHAAWVDNKADAAGDLPGFVGRFVEFDEQTRTAPIPGNVKACRDFKKTYLALSKRVRGEAGGEDPFALRRVLTGS
ncbi:MAG: FGGY family carbohydrate kinase [Elusimicrobia bacterium]|nr:FGGY family carbohydrate kinase [Elusimicrobiota bacterium]